MQTPEHKHIASLLTTYHNLSEDYEDSLLDEVENPFYGREMVSIKRRLDSLGVFFHHLPLFGQRHNDCWYVACQKIVWYHLEKFNLLGEWVDRPVLKDGRPNPLQIWERNQGLYLEDRYVLKKFGFKPVPSNFTYLTSGAFPTSKFKNISCADLRENLEKFGPLWVSLYNFGSAANHATVIVGVGKDCVILNDSSKSRKDPTANGRIIVRSIEDFNKHFVNSDPQPIWYYPMQWQGAGLSFA